MPAIRIIRRESRTVHGAARVLGQAIAVELTVAVAGRAVGGDLAVTVGRQGFHGISRVLECREALFIPRQISHVSDGRNAVDF